MTSKIDNSELAQHDFATCFDEAKKKEIPLVTSLNEKGGQYSLKRDDLKKVFDSSLLWIKINKKGGHLKYKHQLTQVVIEYQGHNPKGSDNTVNPSIAIQVRDALQEHINILGNTFFQFKIYNWKKSPDFKKTVDNFNKWKPKKNNLSSE